MEPFTGPQQGRGCHRVRGGDAGNMALFLVGLHNLAGAAATHRTPCATWDAAAVKPIELEPGLGRAISHM